MKRSLTILAGAILAMASAAHAQTVIKITGSTAYRNDTVKAITNLFTGGYSLSYNGGSNGTSPYATFRGTVTGIDGEVIVKTSWTGSEAGIRDVAASNNNVTFLKNPTGNDAAGGANGTSGGTLRPDSDRETGVADIAMSDTRQASSAYLGTYQGKTYDALTEAPGSPVGVIAFQFVVSETGATKLTNITTQQMRNLLSAGYERLSNFTGDNADRNTYVFAAGRDFESGTRLTTLAEVGLSPTAVVKQYQPLSGGNPVTTANANPDGNRLYVQTGQIPGNWGGSSGNLVNFLTMTTGSMVTNISGTNVTGGFYVGYLGTSDAVTAVNGGALALSFNGVPYSQANVENGLYSFWGFERMYYRGGLQSTDPVVVYAEKLSIRLRDTDATLKVGAMKVTRGADGGTVQGNQLPVILP